MLKCVELTPQGLDTYSLPLEPVTAPRLHNDKGHRSLVVGYETRRVTFAEQPAALSLKCSFAGPVNYVVDGRRVVVQEDRYLIVNHNHAYSSYVESEQPVTAFSVFFGRPFVQEVLTCLARSEESLLESPLARLEDTGFFEHLQPHNPQLWRSLKALHAAHGQDRLEPGWLHEELHRLLAGLAQADQALLARMESLPALKPATRREVFRRVSLARDHIDSHYREPLSLELLAGVACMAPHHFLRSFKQAIGTTPHQYLMERRLERASSLLQQDLTVAQAAERVGFESWEHFSRLFRRRFGKPPGALRKKQDPSFPLSA